MPEGRGCSLLSLQFAGMISSSVRKKKIIMNILTFKNKLFIIYVIIEKQY